MPADKGLIDALIELKEDRLEANGVANDAEATATDEPATKPKRAPKRRSKSAPNQVCSTASTPRTFPPTSVNSCAVAPL